MRERNQQSGQEAMEGRKVAILEHLGCAGTVGTVVNEDTNNFQVRCDDCNKSVIIDIQNTRLSGGQNQNRINPGR